MGGGGLLHGAQESADVALAETELGELEVQELELVPHARGGADGDDGEIRARSGSPPAAVPARGRTRPRSCRGAGWTRMLSRSTLRPGCREANSGSRPPDSRKSPRSSASRRRLFSRSASSWLRRRRECVRFRRGPWSGSTRSAPGAAPAPDPRSRCGPATRTAARSRERRAGRPGCATWPARCR